MVGLISDLFGYLKSVFFETWQKVFTLFDILGLLLFFYPKVARCLEDNPSLAKTIGGLMFFISFLIANFSLYRKLIQDIPHQADLRLAVQDNGFSYPHGIGRSPFREIRSSPTGFSGQGLPDWGSLWANIRITNYGR
jgi:hypothetical protein